jgi:hypothetical protein
MPMGRSRSVMNANASSPGANQIEVAGFIRDIAIQRRPSKVDQMFHRVASTSYQWTASQF